MSDRDASFSTGLRKGGPMNSTSQSFRTSIRPFRLAVASTMMAFAGLTAVMGCKDPKPKVTSEVKPTTTPNPFAATPTSTPAPDAKDPRCADEENYVCDIPQDLVDLCSSEGGEDKESCDNKVWTKKLYDRIVGIQKGEGDPELSDCPAPTLYVNTSADPLNLRDAPKGGDESSILTAIGRGQAVTCKGKVKDDPSWTKVSASGQEGYMASQYLSNTPPAPIFTGGTGTGTGNPSQQNQSSGTNTGVPGICWEVVAENVQGSVALGSTCADKNNDPVGWLGGAGIGNFSGEFWSGCVTDPAKLGSIPTQCICKKVRKTSTTKANCKYTWEPVL